MTTHVLHGGFRHAAGVMTHQVLAVIAVTVCTLLGFQLFQLSRLIDLEAIAAHTMSFLSNAMVSAITART